MMETIRGHTLGPGDLGRAGDPDTGVPEAVRGKSGERVLRAPADGILVAHRQIGDLISQGEIESPVWAVRICWPHLMVRFAG